MMLLYIKISDNQLIIGLTTKSKLNVLLKDGDVTVYQERTFYRAVRKNGDVTVYQERTFYRAVREFYQTAVKYALDHLPLDDEVIQNLQFVDVTRKLESNINQVLYFCQRCLFYEQVNFLNN
jgi:(2Fe-2S) ferredoxin